MVDKDRSLFMASATAPKANHNPREEEMNIEICECEQVWVKQLVTQNEDNEDHRDHNESFERNRSLVDRFFNAILKPFFRFKILVIVEVQFYAMLQVNAYQLNVFSITRTISW